MRSLRTKLVLYISLLVAALVGVSGFIEVRKRSGELNQELVEGAQNFAAISASSVLDSAGGLYYQPDKFPELEAKVRQVMARNRALTRVEVVDALFGIVLFDSREFDEGYYGFDRDARTFAAPQLLRSMELNKVVLDRGEDLVRVAVPLFAGKEVGDPRDVNRAVVFHYSTGAVKKQLADMRLRYALQALIFVIFGVLLAALESNAITRPLRILTEGVQRIGAGQLDHRVEVATGDELGLLSGAFNNMTASLKQSRDDLVLALEQVEKQNVELKEMDKLKDQFLANTSHELRTPINGILGLVTAVLEGADGPINPKQQRHLQMVKDSGDRLKNLITNILDFSKVKSGKEKFEFSPLKLADLGPHIAALGEGLLRAKNVSMIVELPAELPVVYGDPDRLMQVLTNLVGNAAKFTDKGHVRVYGEQREGQLVIAVEDTGPGIPPQARDYLFQEFRQVDGSAARQHEGTGLGLAISKQLVERMGGKIDFRSELGKGTVFFFSLPTREDDIPQGVTVSTVAAGLRQAAAVDTLQPTAVIGGAGAPARRDVDLTAFQGAGEVIAIADDLPENVEALKLLMEQNGYKTFTARSGPELLDRLAHERAHLVLCDVRMPGLSGVDVCRAIRTSPSLARLPVFLVTAQAATADDLYAATQAGVDGYVLKPFDPAALLERVHAVLKPRPDTPRGRGQRVLVVDDSQVAAEGLARHIEAFGYHAIPVTDPRKAFQVAMTENPDLAILDVRLGPITGFELCQQLRSEAMLAKMPVVFLTGLTSPTDKLRFREVGAQDLLAKPVAADELLRRMAFFLQKSANELERRGNGEKVLVVDDVEVNVEALATQLEHRGYTPLRALSGQKALELARQEKPHVIISDVMMPGMTGYDLCRELQQDADAGNPPVILLTAQTGTLQDKLLGFDAGAVDYVVKPFEPEELMARLGRLLLRGSGGTASGTSITRMVASSSEDAATTASAVDIRGTGELVLCVDDNPINLEVLKTNLEAVNYRVVTAGDGVEALEKLGRINVDLILLDVMMPRMTGYEFLTRMRQDPKHKDIPVVIVSAKDRPEDSLAGFKQGVVDYVTKPFEPSLVAAKVAAILALRRAQSALGTINAELNVARLVQQASFPQQVLDLPGYAVRGLIQCAETSGGDWYGYFTSPRQDRMTLVAGDVTGHGISAALVALAVNSIKATVELVEGLLDTSQHGPAMLAALEGKVPDPVRAGLKRLLEVPHSPSALAGLINEVFCQSRSFLKMTSVVLNVDLPSGLLRYTLAGAPRPLHLRRSQKGDGGWEVASLTSLPGSILGHDRQARYSEQAVTLAHGEAVLLFSDGLTEAQNARGDQFGSRRVLQALQQLTKGQAKLDPMELRDGLLRQVFAFAADAPLEDDVTLVVMQRLAQ